MDDWKYAPAADLDQRLDERLRGFPRQPHLWMYTLRSAAALIMRGWLRAFHRFEVVGKSNLPLGSSFVMVANHQSHLDAPCLLASLPFSRLHQAFPAAAADYFFSSLPRSAFSSIVVNGLPFDRVAGGAESLAVCRRLLQTPGNVLIIFPEGTRSTGEIGRFRSGIGRLVGGSDVPVVPCHLAGAATAFPKGRLLPRPTKVVLRIGPPRTFGGLADGPERAQRIAADLRDAVLGLGGEE